METDREHLENKGQTKETFENESGHISNNEPKLDPEVGRPMEEKDVTNSSNESASQLAVFPEINISGQSAEPEVADSGTRNEINTPTTAFEAVQPIHGEADVFARKFSDISNKASSSRFTFKLNGPPDTNMFVNVQNGKQTMAKHLNDDKENSTSSQASSGSESQRHCAKFSHFCSQCLQVFSSKKKLKVHLRSHQNVEKALPQTEATKAAKKSSRECKIVVNSESGSYSCKICKVFLQTRNDFRQHIIQMKQRKKLASNPDEV
jgi:hypothetical protein